jgi:hypothetical protein
MELRPTGMRFANGAAVALLLVACTWVQCFHLGSAWANPHGYFGFAYHDGLKNFYTPDYYLRYDSGLHFSGLNYPYGEHVVYTDNQPLLLWLLNGLDDHGIALKAHLPELMLGFMALSMYLAALLLYALLRRFGTGPWTAAAGGCLLAFLSPQLHRAGAHYALYYPVFVATWYGAVRLYGSRREWLWALALVGWGVAIGLVHLYYALLQLFFCGALAGVLLLRFRRSWAARLRPAIGLLAGGLLPMVLLTAFMAATDPVADRPAEPWGSTLYVASFRSVFWPDFGALAEALDGALGREAPEMEGWGYVGLPGTLCGLLLAVRGFRRLLSARWGTLPRLSTDAALNDSVWAATGVLLFACAVPFQLGLDFLYDWLPKLKQFRSLGRMAWVFYYVFGVFALHSFFVGQKIFFRKKRKLAGALLLGGVLAVWSYDTYRNVRQAGAPFARIAESAPFDTIRFDERLLRARTEKADFQAILPLPYYHVGSEKFSQERGAERSFLLSVICSRQTGLPIAADFLSRTSLSQTLKLLQLFSAPPLEKTVLRDFPDDRPLLVVHDREGELSAAEERLMAFGQLLYQDGQCRLLRLPLSAFAHTADSLRAAYAAAGGQLPNPALWEDDYAAHPEVPGMDGPGARHWEAPPPEGVVLYDAPVPLAPGLATELEVSVWVRADHRYRGMPTLACTAIGPGENRLEQTVDNGPLAVDSWRDWVRLSVKTRADRPGLRYEIKLYADRPVTADRLMVRPADRDGFQQSVGGAWYWNNYPLER